MDKELVRGILLVIGFSLLFVVIFLCGMAVISVW